MSASQPIALSRPDIPAAGRALLALLSKLRHGSLKIVTPDGEELWYGALKPQADAELTLADWRACRRMLSGNDIGFAEAYRDGWLDSPDLTALLRLALRNEDAMQLGELGRWAARAWHRLRHLLRVNSRRGSRRNIHAHYDIGNDFYQLWLDPGWTYSSAWFDGDYRLSLADAQARKYQRICDQLQLRPGMRVLEIGCGWGGFAEHAARLGVAVHGITISDAQLDFARRRLVNEPLAILEHRDYRDLSGQYDAIVSIEMFEAVGERYWRGYFDTLRRCLKPGGQALAQSITIEESRFETYRANADFIQTFIFPGGMLPSRERFLRAARQGGLACRGRLDFGPDYAETLRRWRDAFEANLAAIRSQGFDEAFIRLWRLYLCYCEAGFDEGRIGVSQFLLQRHA
ncbi:cyclopropane-fatty-acyl-phospholipid synthase family protein [Chromobacterium subtsugae]|uniref:Cyclopropane-fatty-acyl-phospholipid synthase family protein n=1 Tax=Chromobacterium subtsugae TaxID=251747 RepID=A0ABS7FJ15_9NEIS|nr:MULTISPECIES: cyclopropane-fatty-acyl-phospholipid synthase family protein [Chromobacterium]KUM03771.1 cyclopropane-fatty-acyl-phospholipid synthase [Chromobacterium subtsugae]KZE85129.1 cyclopropane-fatty-acyl-phospholipid synthase [Chromobacterium sp. F49]MBW7568995.1 class I SAM-dependent methyltransferase [Chromobacterium subtsugae]MBW8289976.1 cyclopropane-fatty-acyl-phospholipid synthase family protein [Chromobacterium subtsugae]WSE92516.1 cyclopropane-fatty-acyl-phospholipid synthase